MLYAKESLTLFPDAQSANKPPGLVSACLLGIPCRWHGHRSDGVTGTDPCTVQIEAARDVGGAAWTGLTITVRPLGDSDGSRLVTTADRVLRNKILNGLAAP